MDPEPPLALLLLRAARWFDRRLLEALVERGEPRLTPAQSLVFAHLDATGTPPAELARRLGTSRQSASELVAGLVRLGLLETREDSRRPRGRLVVLTPDGARVARTAATVLRQLERELEPEVRAALREGLAPLQG